MELHSLGGQAEGHQGAPELAYHLRNQSAIHVKSTIQITSPIRRPNRITRSSRHVFSPCMRRSALRRPKAVPYRPILLRCVAIRGSQTMPVTASGGGTAVLPSSCRSTRGQLAAVSASRQFVAAVV